MAFFMLDPFSYTRPSRIMDQHFGLSLDSGDFISPIIPREMRNLASPLGYLRPWQSRASQKEAGSTVSVTQDKFQVNLDVQQFKPEEITVKVAEDTVTVEGKHEEKQDEHGYVSRHFVRRYVLPKGHDLDKVESKLSSDGVLTITAPKDGAKLHQRNIPIVQTGKPSIGSEEKKIPTEHKVEAKVENRIMKREEPTEDSIEEKRAVKREEPKGEKVEVKKVEWKKDQVEMMPQGKKEEKKSERVEGVQRDFISDMMKIVKKVEE